MSDLTRGAADLAQKGLLAARKPRPVYHATKHVDAKALGADVAAWLARHPGWTGVRLSTKAGLGRDYAGRLLRGDLVTGEVAACKAGRLRACMRRIESNEGGERHG